MKVLCLFKIKSAVFAYTTVSEINEKTLDPFLQTLGKKSSGVCSSEPEYTPSLSFVIFRMHTHSFITFYKKVSGQENRGYIFLYH